MIVTGLVCALCLGVVIGPPDGVAAALGHTGPDPGLRPGLVQGVLLGAADVLINGVPAAAAFALVHGTGVLLRGGAPEPSRVRIRLGGRAGRSRARSGPEILARAGLGIAGGPAGGFGIGLVQGLVRKLLTGDPLALRVGLVDGVIYGAMFAFAGGISGALMAWCEATVDIVSAPAPRELLGRNRRTALLQWFMFAPLFGVATGAAGRPAVEFLDGYLWGIRLGWTVPDALRFGLLAAFGAGIGAGLSLTAWGQWAVFARLWLPLTGRLPRVAMTFLEDARWRGVLRKVGAVYQFRHTRIQQHFARPPVRPGHPEEAARRRPPGGER
ncbi:hypothetical protein ACFXKJ_05065 [Kitasatospora indigofera]|uniref:hypothetical protein n=1 Tax=Kitasatospora indigofera TaxID=67307 RepID=UPI0036C0A658